MSQAAEQIARQFANANVNKVTWGDIIINVKVYGAKGDGVTDDALAIQQAISAAAAANAQTGHAARTTLFFPPGVYLIKSTLTFQPFINYVGVRATTADTDSSFTYANSRGTIIRADTSLYTAANKGVLVYVPTGDITIENITFVGTASINGNSSIGIQWGSTGGASSSGRPHETDGTGQNVGGVSIRNCTFYTFTKAWECNTLFDTYGWGNRFESNTTNIVLQNNTALSTYNQIELYGTVMFGHSIGVQISGSATARHLFKMVGGSFEGVFASVNHIYYVGSTSPSEVTLRFEGVSFSHLSSSSTNHLFMVGAFDSSTWNVDFNGCALTTGGISLQRNSGSASVSNVRFNGCTLKSITITLNIARYIDFVGGKMEACSITATISNKCSVRDVFVYNVTTFITVAGNDCGDWVIVGNRFDTVTTPLSINQHPTNSGWLVRENHGLDGFTILTSGATSINVAGSNGKFRTNNSTATTISSISNGYSGQQITVVFADGNTTIDFTGTNIKGNGGVDKTMSTSNVMYCTYDGTNWMCAIG